MEETVREYIINKELLAALFIGENYLVEEMTENKEYETYLFETYNLKCIRNVIKTPLSVRVFDDDKTKTIKNAMKYYLKNNNNIDDEKLKLIKEILNAIGLPNLKSNDKFYKLQYEIRNGEKCEKLTPEIKEKMDFHILKDAKYLIDIAACISGEEVQIFKNDVNFLKSVNMFIDECPELLAFPQVENYIRTVLEENEKITDNEELTRLNNSLLEYFDEILERSLKLNYEIAQQTIFSLMFNDNIIEILDEVKVIDNGEGFFSQQMLDIICNIIDLNKEKCMFDGNIIENVRELVLTFNEKGLLNTEKLNELKKKLNVYMNEDYKKKNDQFYINIFKNYNNDRYIIKDHSKFKSFVNTLIRNTDYFLAQLRDFTIPTNELAYDDFAAMYINYILDNYPLIREDILYIERIKEITEYNYAYLIHKQPDILFLNNNVKLGKKIKILQK